MRLRIRQGPGLRAQDHEGGLCAQPREGGTGPETRLREASRGQGPVTQDAARGQPTALGSTHRSTREVPPTSTRSSYAPRPSPPPQGHRPHNTPCGLLDSVGKAVKHVFILGFN